jgi:Cys-tRNA(Pro) deacylase
MADVTAALDALAAAGVPHEVIRTDRARSVEEAAELRGVPVSGLIKTLVVRRAEDDYVFVLVPGDRIIDWPKLRVLLGERRMTLPDADEAKAVTGYERGTITPFGATHPWPVVIDAAAATLEVLSLGGGAHGVSVKLAAADLVAALGAQVADVTRPG